MIIKKCIKNVLSKILERCDRAGKVKTLKNGKWINDIVLSALTVDKKIMICVDTLGNIRERAIKSHKKSLKNGFIPFDRLKYIIYNMDDIFIYAIAI